MQKQIVERKSLFSVSGLVCCPVLLYCMMLHAYSENYAAAKSAPANEDAEAIVVLTGSKGRIAYAIKHCRPGQKLFISGTETYQNLEWLCRKEKISQSMLKTDIANVHLGARAVDTCGNALETLLWLKSHPEIHNILVVTSDAHLARAHFEMKILPSKYKVSYASVGHVNHFLNFGEIGRLFYRYCGIKPLKSPLRSEKYVSRARNSNGFIAVP